MKSVEIPEEAARAAGSVISAWTGGNPDDDRMAKEALLAASPLIVAAELYRLASEHSTEASETGLPWYVVDVDTLTARAAELRGE